MTPIEGNLCPVCGERMFSFSIAETEVHAGPASEPCGLCRRAVPAYARAVAYGSFENTLRDAIHLLKYARVLPAADFLGGKLSVAMAQLPAPDETRWVVVPVPLHRTKLRQRGFNQSELIARAVLKRQPASVGLRLNTNILARQRETASQAGLTRHQRRENLRGAFVVRDPSALRNRDVLLVDDVFTTGTTVSECARVLLRAGVRRVWVATVARTLKADRIRAEGITNGMAAREAAA